jgi:ribosomal protein S18 acetylase RimI-like enzyme
MSEAFEIRDYRSDDGAACHEIRRSAFFDTFNDFLPRADVEAGAASFAVDAFEQRLGAMRTFVATRDGAVVGFCTMRRVSERRAELVHLYVSATHRGTGIGPRLVRHAEGRMLKEMPSLETIYLETCVPLYNQPFWERMGYRVVGKSACEYSTGSIPSVRMEKAAAGSSA